MTRTFNNQHTDTEAIMRHSFHHLPSGVPLALAPAPARTSDFIQESWNINMRKPHLFLVAHSSKGQFSFFVNVAFAYQQLKIPPPACLLRHDVTPRQLH